MIKRFRLTPTCGATLQVEPMHYSSRSASRSLWCRSEDIDELELENVGLKSTLSRLKYILTLQGVNVQACLEEFRGLDLKIEGDEG